MASGNELFKKLGVMRIFFSVLTSLLWICLVYRLLVITEAGAFDWCLLVAYAATQIMRIFFMVTFEGTPE